MAEVWVVGAAGTGKTALVQGLAGRSQQLHAAPPADQPDKLVPLNIDNKYYTAQAWLRELPTVAPRTGQPEALVLVISATQPDSLVAAREWCAQDSCEEAGVRLLVATHADRLPAREAADPAGTWEPQRPAWLQEAIEWSGEQQLEYVECSCTDASVDAALPQGEDVQGISRVLEALHAHMWPGLVRKRPAQAPGTAAPHSDAPQQERGSHEGPRDVPQGAIAATQGQGAASAPSAQPAKQGQSSGTARSKKDLSAAEVEEQMDAFERLMEEMAGGCQ